METEKKFGKKGELKMNLENLTEEEINEMLKNLSNLLKEIEKKEEYYYEFKGTWVWGVWANNQEEAEGYFKNACIGDFDILTDEYEMKKYN